ncbi:DUF58 domain-containing protein [Allosphingosinicella deserti]|uniref:DUF58 domain-containing protein n=1 Tax=Allosphingosinicella deserti TaxID=2116704 RepID=A0A2P7QN06_9SPHN|nr:DUF58 domain-containing protein [Sphingomonas deserti]PSJ39353.1 DUF58 domain-containing protein [Sphingomonas deserti]
MIYPSARAIVVAGASAPVALLIGVLAPAYWVAGLAFLGFLIVLLILDAALGAAPKDVAVTVGGPRSAAAGSELAVDIQVTFAKGAPTDCEIAIGSHYLLEAPNGLRSHAAIANGRGTTIIPLVAIRRGVAGFEHVWVRWRGPLGLVWKQRQLAVTDEIVIVPDIRALRERSADYSHRDMLHGLTARMQIGEGAEFDSLADFQQGMDRRAIDWKQSARHRKLLAKEYRTERNNNVIIALDSGRTMCEPLVGLPKIDRAVSAALLTAYVALKDGDRVSLFGFDSHPRVSTKPVSGARSFALLQRVAGAVEYSDRETNYTLGLATLATGLQRRSLIVIFTDFADTVSAELMLAAVGTLLKRHLVLFILFRDEELEGFAAAEPNAPEDVTRAVTAAALLRQRRLVVNRLRRLGVHVIEAAHDRAGPALVNAYLEVKQRNLL